MLRLSGCLGVFDLLVWWVCGDDRCLGDLGGLRLAGVGWFMGGLFCGFASCLLCLICLC